VTIPAAIRERLQLPLISAPMFRVSGPDLVVAACKHGVIGSFPTANCRSVDELDHWIREIRAALAPTDAPFCANLIMRREGMREHLHCLLSHRVEIVVTRVGSPEEVIGPLHDIGCIVLADVASLRHAHKAAEAGADGLVLLTAGAGGQTGWVNGFAFVRAVRRFFDGIVVMAGGMADGQAVWAARALGCDLAYMGTKFIATHESMADEHYKQMLVTSEIDDVLLSRAFTGLETNMLRPSIIAAGLDPAKIPAGVGQEGAAALYGGSDSGPRRWKDIWSAGHAVSGVGSVCGVGELVERTRREYESARNASREFPL
jgi:nitronate monooxygenase